MSSDAFSRLATPIQRSLWRMRWTKLRPIQEEAIRQILDNDNDIIISARTAAGKTEAAFLPILSQLSESPGRSVGAMYVSPLKALINDQFRRLEELCQYAEIPVHRWHGDIATDKKRQLLARPGGVVLITPESLESLFVNRSNLLEAVFADLRFVVIDELHAFVGRERGTHLRSLLFRLNRYASKPFRIVALSATLGDEFLAYAEWVRPGDPNRVEVITDVNEQKTIRYQISGRLDRPPAIPGVHPHPIAEESANDSLTQEIHDAFVGNKGLVFANRKEEVEMYGDALNELCRRNGELPQFLVHHGSLSKEIREHAEMTMRGPRAATTLCSATLELGIDIGNVAAVGQIGSPWSVSSLVQRLGRSGRGENEPSVMYVYVHDAEPTAQSPFVARLYPDLLQAIALTELMKQKWVEPPVVEELDLSTLVQQILSILAETGGLKADTLCERLVIHGAFRTISEETLVAVLRSMGGHDLVEQPSDGRLILGLAGQRIVGHFDFYSAFATPEEYQVSHEGRPIGTLPATALPRERDHLVLGGRRWEVARIRHERKEILVVPASGRKPPQFVGSGGEIHPRVRQEMRAILLDDRPIDYLNDSAARLLVDARLTARKSGLATSPILQTGDHTSLWFTWTGTKAQRALLLMARIMGIDATNWGLAIEFRLLPADVRRHYTELLRNMPSPHVLAAAFPGKYRRKYDWYLTDELLCASVAASLIDVEEATRVISTMG